MTYNIYVYNLIGGMMAVSKEILDLIPQGCKVNWNEKQHTLLCVQVHLLLQ